MKLKDRVAVITGSGGGIGRAAAIEFARDGARVVVADIKYSRERGKRPSRSGNSGGNAHAVETDVSNPESVRNLVRETLRVYSKVNVSVQQRGDTGEQDRGRYHGGGMEP